MEMYKNNYAACVLLDGKVLPESDGAVVMPFGSEYKVRLRNKGRIRSVADICIDGVTAAKGIVVDPDSSVDIERFLGESLTSGRKFQLARLTDSRVSQPGESQNGLLEIRFYQEKPAPAPAIKVEHVTHHYPCSNPYCTHCQPWKHYHPDPYTWKVTDTFTSSSYSSEGFKGTPRKIGEVHDGAACSDWMPVEHNVKPASLGIIARGIPEAAATVQGSISDQRFTSVAMEIDTSSCVTLTLKLMGTSRILDVCPCGRKRDGEKFCPNCGHRLVD